MRANASTGVGGGESCVNRDALRLLTTCSITVSLSRAIFANVLERMPARCVLRVTQRDLPASVSGGTDVAVLLVMRGLGRPRRGRWLGHPGGHRAARGQHVTAPGPSGVWLVVLGTNDAARLAPIARMSWMLAGHVPGPIHEHPAVCSRWRGRDGPV